MFHHKRELKLLDGFPEVKVGSFVFELLRELGDRLDRLSVKGVHDVAGGVLEDACSLKRQLYALSGERIIRFAEEYTVLADLDYLTDLMGADGSEGVLLGDLFAEVDGVAFGGFD
jgi:hypothetical protein